MELFDEDFATNKKTDNKKTTTIILILIIFLIVMMLVVVGIMIYIKQTEFVLKLDDKDSSVIKNMINIDKETPSRVYVPIKQIAKEFGYQAYDGSYTTKSEEPNECYVESKDEVAMFSLGSKKIYKTLTTGDINFECYDIDEPVKAINGELYTTIEGAKTAFNIDWSYDVENRKMRIYTIPYLVERYSQFVVNNGYASISNDFINQKAILKEMLVVNKNTENNGTKVAVLDISGNEMKVLLEPKYDEIKYLQHTQDFLVTADGKKGIISKNRRTIVKLQYDNIELMDYNKKLYAVELSGKYGIVDFNGGKVLDTDYSQIGIDISDFKENDIKNKYILADRLVPIKQDEYWALFDFTANRRTEFIYEKIGYVTSNNRAGSGYSLLTVPDYNVIVVGKDKKYSVITATGEEIEGLPFVFDSIYLSIFGGQTTYVLDYNSESYDLTKQLDNLGYGKNRNSSSKTSNSEQADNQEQLSTETTDNQNQEYQESNTEENQQ